MKLEEMQTTADALRWALHRLEMAGVDWRGDYFVRANEILAYGEAERDALRADAERKRQRELDALRKDAERYRKLVASGKYCAASVGGGWGLGGKSTKAQLDAAADALDARLKRQLGINFWRTR